MIAKCTAITKEKINVDMDVLFDVAIDVYNDGLRERTKEEKEDIKFLIEYLKKQDWTKHKFPEDVDDIIDARWDYAICENCPKRGEKIDGVITCKYEETCFNRDEVFSFIEFLEDYANYLINYAKV